MPFPFVPVVLGVGTLFAWHKVKQRQKMTPERKSVFEDAIKNFKEPEKLRELAETFDSEGLRAEGDELRKRAAIIELPPEKKNAYRQAYKNGLSASDPETVKRLATAMHEKGFYGSAKNLRDYAAGLIENLNAKITPKEDIQPETQTEDVQAEPSTEVPGENNASSDSDSTVSDSS